MKHWQSLLISWWMVLPLHLPAQDSTFNPVSVAMDSVRIMPVYPYEKPRPFSFITHIPSDVASYVHESCKKENLYKLGIVVGTTLLFWAADQKITDGWQRACSQLGVEAEQKNRALISLTLGGKTTTIGKIPKNLNTALYNLGQGSTTLFLAAGFFIHGKFRKDNRALQTASQLTQAFITLGLGTQLIKYSTGRETPSSASTSRGAWRPFPSFTDFQSDKSRYDAFPSGHLSTLIATVTIISSNYPEKKWIKPVGYGFAGLCSLAMINNGVHWASDYPLGFALGYGVGKTISRKHRKSFVKPAF